MESALKKVRMAEDAWNSRDPERVALAYSVDSKWRNRTEFLRGRGYRSDGNELWEFDEEGLVRRRLASINDAPIAFSGRRVL